MRTCVCRLESERRPYKSLSTERATGQLLLPLLFTACLKCMQELILNEFLDGMVIDSDPRILV